MRIARTLVASAAVAAVALAPLASVQAASHPAAKHHPVKPRFYVSKLAIIGSRTTFDVTKTAAVIKIRVQVKDHDKAFNPGSVNIVVALKDSDPKTPTAFEVKTRLAGHSRVVSNWLGVINVPAGSASGTYCLRTVWVDPTSTAALPVVFSAPRLPGRDCFTVVNTTPVTPPTTTTPPAPTA